jgi:hypothetical protein
MQINAASSNGCNSSSPDKSNRRFSSLSEAPSGAVDSWVSNPGRSISRERVDSGCKYYPSYLLTFILTAICSIIKTEVTYSDDSSL